MKITVTNKSEGGFDEMFSLDLDQVCSVRVFQTGENHVQCLEIYYAGGLHYRFDADHYDFFHVKPSGREPTTPLQIITKYAEA